MTDDSLLAFLDSPKAEILSTVFKTTPAPARRRPARVNGPAIDKVKAKMDVLAEVLAGLEGRRFDWGMAEAGHKATVLREMGIELVTANGARKRGHVLKKGGMPVGTRYFGARIQRSADVYIFDLQTKPA